VKRFPSTIALALFLAAVSFVLPARGEPITRAEVLKIAQAYCDYRWQASDKNVKQGKDVDGVEVHTPNRVETSGDPNLWLAGAENVGMPYKWGGFDSLESFEAGIKKGKAAGDIYSPEKRKLGGAAVSSNAVGIDCSGFISRCWKLPSKQSTNSLPGLCTKLASIGDLKPGDIMDDAGGHVILFAKWLDGTKTKAQFYESSPYCKVISSSYDVTGLAPMGFQPLRYKQIRD
jgi:hypothetical protein